MGDSTDAQPHTVQPEGCSATGSSLVTVTECVLNAASRPD